MTLQGGKASERQQYREMLRDDYLAPQNAVERRVTEHVLDSLTLEGLEAVADMLHRIDVRAMEAGKKEAELDEYDRGYDNGCRNADRDLVRNLAGNLEPAIEYLKQAMEDLRDCGAYRQAQREMDRIVDEYQPTETSARIGRIVSDLEQHEGPVSVREHQLCTTLLHGLHAAGVLALGSAE